MQKAISLDNISHTSDRDIAPYKEESYVKMTDKYHKI